MATPPKRNFKATTGQLRKLLFVWNPILTQLEEIWIQKWVSTPKQNTEKKSSRYCWIRVVKKSKKLGFHFLAKNTKLFQWENEHLRHNWKPNFSILWQRYCQISTKSIHNIPLKKNHQYLLWLFWHQVDVNPKVG